MIIKGLIHVITFFSVIHFCVLAYFGDNWSSVWVWYALGSVLAVPSFYYVWHCSVLNSLVEFLIVTLLSSALISYGFLHSEFYYILAAGFFIKFGMFPFISWVYRVFTNSSWTVILVICVILKSICSVLLYISGGTLPYPLFWEVWCILSLLFISLSFWIFNDSWCHVWCNVVIASNCVVIILSLYSASYGLFCLYVLYTILSSFQIYFLSKFSSKRKFTLFSPWLILFFSVTFINIPLSLVILYKFITVLCTCVCGVIFTICWAIYCFTEQFYYFCYISSSHKPKKVCKFINTKK